MTIPRTRHAVQALLAAHGMGPRRARGQNFLVDGNMIDAIVRDARVESRHSVLEVGTGTGILTDQLADRAGAVISCDVDTRLQAMTRGLREWPAGVQFIGEDVLCGKHALNTAILDAWRAPGLTLKVVSNLPFNIATPVLANLLWSGLPIEELTVLVQREAAERFTAAPSTPEYGPMAVAIGLLATEARIVREVPPQVFWPQPKVESALLKIVPGAVETVQTLRDAGLPDLLQRAFLHRRKMLRKTVGAAALEAAGIRADVRPEDVPPEAWPRLLTVPPS